MVKFLVAVVALKPWKLLRFWISSSCFFKHRNEYYPADSLVAPSQDLRRKISGTIAAKQIPAEEVNDVAMEEEEEEEEEEKEEGEPINAGVSKKKTRRAAAK